jgi:hypothetical protein
MLVSGCGGNVAEGADTAFSTGGAPLTNFAPSSVGGSSAVGGASSGNGGLTLLSDSQLASIEANICTIGQGWIQLNADAGLFDCHFAYPLVYTACLGTISIPSERYISVVYTTGNGQVLLIGNSWDATCPGGDGYYVVQTDAGHPELDLCPKTCSTVQHDAFPLIQILTECDRITCAI